jgi:hypothetical protein
MLVPQALSASYECGGQMIQVGVAYIARFNLFEVIPDTLVGVKMGA